MWGGTPWAAGAGHLGWAGRVAGWQGRCYGPGLWDQTVRRPCRSGSVFIPAEGHRPSLFPPLTSSLTILKTMLMWSSWFRHHLGIITEAFFLKPIPHSSFPRPIDPLRPLPGSRLGRPSHLWQKALCFTWSCWPPGGPGKSTIRDSFLCSLHNLLSCLTSGIPFIRHSTGLGAANTCWLTRLFKVKGVIWTRSLSLEEIVH